MLTTINKYPYFDLSEIIIERDLSYKAYKALKPVKAGNYVPDIKLDTDYANWQNFYNGAPTPGHIATRQLLSKPLVISFYSKHWQDRGIDQLKQLNALQYEIKANGGNLVIINADGPNEDLAKIAWEHNLSLNFYFDKDNKIAEKFRVYSEEDPTWNTFAGIDVNVPLLATYVVDTAKHIVFDHVDRNLTDTFVADEILTAVYHSALNNSRKSA
jgi:peroxiredoxin